VALTLRLLGGLSTQEVARAFLVSEPTVAQRIVRAKRTLAEKRIPFEVPCGPELAERLSSVLAVVYLIFNEGYSASGGVDHLRPALSDEAMRLGRMLAVLAPEEPEVHGLLALMELNASRSAARTNLAGDPVLLLEQDRARWNPILIRRGLESLRHAEALGGERGPYALQAAISACHARARTPEETNWARIVELYTELYEVAPSPVVLLNRAVAVAMSEGPDSALSLLDELAEEPSLRSYHLLPSARAEMLERLGRLDEARREFERAASLAGNERQRARLSARAKACASRGLR
jgi:predicted RNA polymerase sigma factor